MRIALAAAALIALTGGNADVKGGEGAAGPRGVTSRSVTTESQPVSASRNAEPPPGPRAIRIMPVGDSITRGSYLGATQLANPLGGGWRKLLQDKLRAAGIAFEFVGELDYWAYGENGVVDPLFSPRHHGLAGFSNTALIAGGVVPTPATVLAAKGLPEIRVPGIVEALRRNTPDVVLLMSGANGFNAPERERLIRLICDAFSGELFVATITPQKAPRQGCEGVAAYNASLPPLVAALRAQGNRIHLVDMYTPLSEADLLPDGVHPTESGMAKIATAWFQALCEVPEVRVPSRAAAAPAVPIGTDRQLFLDDRLLDVSRCRDVTRTLNPPRSTRRVLVPDQPWETLGFIFYGNVIEVGDEIRLYYGSYSWDGKIQRHSCLATSPDGFVFERPRLGLTTFAGNKDNNLLPITAIDASIFSDPTAVPAKRYRMVYSAFGLADVARAGVYTAASPDGRNWQAVPTRLLPFVPDSQHTAYWDESLQKYVIYLRAWDRELKRRQVCRLEVRDLEQPWPYDHAVPPYCVWGKDKIPTLSNELPIVMAADGQDPENLDIYTNGVTPYPFAPGVLLAFPAVYLKFKGPEWQGRALSSNDGNFEVQLATSADGSSWTRWRQPYVAAEEHDGRELRLVSMAHGMVRRRRWILQYFVGWPHTHGRPNVWDRDPDNAREWTTKEKGGIYVARQRLDGFVSLDSGDSEGVCTTKPLTFVGDHLCLNLDTRGTGSARVALLDAAGQALPGFGSAACQAINADATDHVVRWHGNPRLESLAGKPVRVQITMQNTKLYALQFVLGEPVPP